MARPGDAPVEIAYEALGDGVKRVEDNERDSAIVQRRALRFARDLPAGHAVAEADLVATRPIPADGVEPYRAPELVGRALRRAVGADELVRLADLEG